MYFLRWQPNYKTKRKEIYHHGPRPPPNLTHLSPSWPLSQFSLVTTSRLFKGFVQPQKRGIKIGTNGFASTSYTIAQSFLGTIKGLLSCFKLQKTGFKKRWSLFWCGVRYQKFRRVVNSRYKPAATATNFREFSFLFPYSPPVHGRSETPPVVTSLVAAGGVRGLYLEVTSHYVLQRFWQCNSQCYSPYCYCYTTKVGGGHYPLLSFW